MKLPTKPMIFLQCKLPCVVGMVSYLMAVTVVAQGMGGYPSAGSKVDQQYQQSLHTYSQLVDQDFRAGSPRYYVVQSGDTYYSIAQRFLTNPNRWAEAWELPTGVAINQDYPLQAGSIVVLSKVKDARLIVFPQGEQALARRYGEYYGIKTGRDTLKLLPVAWSKGINENHILPSDMIEPFKVEANVVPYQDLANAPVIAGFSDNRLMGYPGKDIYVRGHIDEKIPEWYVYGQAERLVDPESLKDLGYVSRLLGIVRPVRRGEDVYTFSVIGGYAEFDRGARLVPVNKNRAYQDYSYQKPSGNIYGRVVGIYDGDKYTTQFRSVVINRGRQHGVKRGDVFNILSHSVVEYAGEIPLDRLPLKGYGRIYVYRVEEGTSFAQVIEGIGEVTIYDYIRPITEDATGGRGIQVMAPDNSANKVQAIRPTQGMSYSEGGFSSGRGYRE